MSKKEESKDVIEPNLGPLVSVPKALYEQVVELAGRPYMDIYKLLATLEKVVKDIPPDAEDNPSS